MVRSLGGFTFRACVVFGLVALLGGYALAASLAQTTGTVGGQGLSATVHFFKALSTGYQDASALDKSLPGGGSAVDVPPAPAPKKKV